MLVRARALFLKWPVLVALGLVAGYFLFAYFAFGPLARWGATKYIADKTGHRLSLARPEFDPLALTLRLRDLRLAEPNGAPLLAFDELFVDFQARSLLNWAYTFERIQLSGARARLELRPDGRLNWMPFIDAFKDPEEEPDKPLPRLLARSVALDRGSVEFIDRKVSGGFETRVEPIDFDLEDLSTLPDDKGDYTLSTRTRLGARVRWKGQLGLNPALASGDIAVDEVHLDKLWPYMQARLAMAPPTGKLAATLSYRLAYADKHLSLKLDKLGARLDGLVLRGAQESEPSLTLGQARLGPASFDLDKRELVIAEIAVAQGRLDIARRADGRVNVQDWFVAAPGGAEAAAPAPAPAEAGKGKVKPAAQAEAAPPWRVSLGRFSLDGVSARYRDAGFAQPLGAEIGNIRVAFKAQAEMAAAAPQARLDDLNVDLADLRLTTAGQGAPLASLGRVALEQGSIDLSARNAKVARLALNDLRAGVTRAADGSLPLLKAIAPLAARPAAPPADTARAGPAWTWRVDSVDLTKLAVALRDEGVAPALALDIVDGHASLAGLGDNLKAPLPVKLGARLGQGGSLEASGKLVPAAASAELGIKLVDINLTPAQAYLGQATNLVLSSGRLSTSGHLRYAKSLDYNGGFAIDDLLVNEAVGGDRLLAWRRLSTDALKATPSGIDIGDLHAEGLGLKFIIDADKSTNLARIKKPAPTTEPVSAAPAASAPAVAAPSQAAAPSFRVGVESIRIAEGEMDFADHSLALPFGTRIHGLKGHVDGISTDAAAGPAQLELEGQVDEYGLARAYGQIKLLDPTGYTDVRSIFRNVEMARLTPYSATFAGRRIASGKLSLDLEYKIKQRQLQGDNQIIMDKLTLGERVESPSAKNLPLDLAIAILQDSEGRIDLGLPVSGSLDDPQFSYGGIIWKAIVNVIGKIVLAPFKALASLLGGNAEKMESIAFDIGAARLLPPEREKLKQLAGALAKRPGLALSIKGAYDPERDRAFLREDQLRRAVAARMGAKLAADAEAPAIATGNPKAREALDAVYAERLGKAALEKLLDHHRRANPEKKEGVGKLFSKFTGLFKGKEEPVPAEELEALKDADVHEVMYRRLLAQEQVGDATLAQLARRRAQAIVDELAERGGVARQRLAILEPEKVSGSEAVSVKLALDVVGKAAPRAE
jgi:hypothetical protein